MSESFEPEPSHWSEALGDILSWDEHARNYYGHITDRRYETLPEDHLALHSGLALDILKRGSAELDRAHRYASRTVGLDPEHRIIPDEVGDEYDRLVAPSE